LVNQGADISATSYDGKTPFTLAIENNKPGVAEYLERRISSKKE